MIPVWTHAARRTREEVSREQMPMLGIAAAFSFLAMMFNVPVLGGTTGHAVCGTLIAILFGPWPAVIALSVALALQAVLFGDGGVLALGANCFNMAFVLPMVGFGVYSLVLGGGRRAEAPCYKAPRERSNRRVSLHRELVAAGVGSYVGINAAALCAAVEFGVQPLLFTNATGQALYCPYPLWVSVPAMMLAHLTVCGAVEVVFTVGILAYVRKVAPSFGSGGSGVAGPEGSGVAGPEGSGVAGPEGSGAAVEVAAGADAPAEDRRSAGAAPRAMLALVAVLIALVPLGLLAEGDAWGEWAPDDVAAAVGYTPEGLAHGWEWTSLMPDYSWGGLPDWLGYVLSAVIGVALLVIVFRIAASVVHAKVDFGER